MNGREKRLSGARRGNTAAAAGLPYVIELWNLPRTEVERIVARADTLLVARAIFNAAAAENPSRRLVLRQGDRVIDDRS